MATHKLGFLQTLASCSVCLESVSDANERSIAKLICGHFFHLGISLSLSIYIYLSIYTYINHFLYVIFMCICTLFFEVMKVICILKL